MSISLTADAPSMLNILINAYACCPGMGSEPGMGWNWIVSLARYCKLTVITEGEFRPQIEEWFTHTEHKAVSANIRFHWNPVTEHVRRMCWNQGDWRFYWYYKRWQKKAADIARDLCKEERIDILHQLNMIGFREPGYLWQVSHETGIPFVWGPVGGLKQYPIAYANDGPLAIRAFLRLKNFLNIWQLKLDKRVDAGLRQATIVIASTPDSYRALRRYKKLESIVIPETGTFPHTEWIAERGRFHSDELTLLWVGKFDFRKRLDIAIATIAKGTSEGVRLRLKVFGTGNNKQTAEARQLARHFHVEDRIEWKGSCPNNQIIEEMRQADLFLFTSVSEDTSTVVLEAISNDLPVLCFDTCGMSSVITNEVGMKIPLSNPEQSVTDFCQKISHLYHHREMLTTMSENCKKRAEELSWDKKAEKMASLYYHCH